MACDVSLSGQPTVHEGGRPWMLVDARDVTNHLQSTIDNLPSILPCDSSEDFAAQLLPSLLSLQDIESGVWGKARCIFDQHIAALN